MKRRSSIGANALWCPNRFVILQPRFEKRSGPDYVVTVRVVDGNYTVTVFGADDEAQAVADAIHSLDIEGFEFEVVSVEKA